MLPEDDFILLSVVNTYLRDGGTLGDFCAGYNAEEGEVIARLKGLGYEFCKESNAFKPA